GTMIGLRESRGRRSGYAEYGRRIFGASRRIQRAGTRNDQDRHSEFARPAVERGDEEITGHLLESTDGARRRPGRHPRSLRKTETGVEEQVGVFSSQFLGFPRWPL